MVNEGKLTEEEALARPDSNVITHAIGDCDLPCDPDIISCHIEEGDILLLCSDGLSGYAINKEIERKMFWHCTDVDECRDELLAMALDKGGEDNISIIVASLIDDNASRPPSPTLFKKTRLFLKI